MQSLVFLTYFFSKVIKEKPLGGRFGPLVKEGFDGGTAGHIVLTGLDDQKLFSRGMTSIKRTASYIF